MMLNQGRPAIITHSSFSLVAIKERKAEDEDQVDDVFSMVVGRVTTLLWHIRDLTPHNHETQDLLYRMDTQW